MSTVLAYKTKNLSILITDTRITKHQNNNIIIDDDNVKMHYIPNKGFIAGAGIGELLLEMQSNILKNANDLDIYRPVLRSAFLTAYQSLVEECNEKSFMERLMKTGIYVSWKDSCCNLRLFSYGFEEEIYRDLKESL